MIYPCFSLFHWGYDFFCLFWFYFRSHSVTDCHLSEFGEYQSELHSSWQQRAPKTTGKIIHSRGKCQWAFIEMCLRIYGKKTLELRSKIWRRKPWKWGRPGIASGGSSSSTLVHPASESPVQFLQEKLSSLDWQWLGRENNREAMERPWTEQHQVRSETVRRYLDSCSTIAQQYYLFSKDASETNLRSAYLILRKLWHKAHAYHYLSLCGQAFLCY